MKTFISTSVLFIFFLTKGISQVIEYPPNYELADVIISDMSKRMFSSKNTVYPSTSVTVQLLTEIVYGIDGRGKIEKILKRVYRKLNDECSFVILVNNESHPWYISEISGMAGTKNKWVIPIGPGVNVEDSFSDYLIRNNVDPEDIKNLSEDFMTDHTAYFVEYRKVGDTLRVKKITNFDDVNNKSQDLKRKKIRALTLDRYKHIIASSPVEANKAKYWNAMFKQYNHFLNKEVKEEFKILNEKFARSEANFNEALRRYQDVVKANAKFDSFMKIAQFMISVSEAYMEFTGNDLNGQIRAAKSEARTTKARIPTVRNEYTRQYNIYIRDDRILQNFRIRNSLPSIPWENYLD